MSLIKFSQSFVCRIKEIHWLYKIHNSTLRVKSGGCYQKGRHSRIINSSVYVDRDSCLILEDDAFILNTDVYVHGIIHIGKNSYLGDVNKRMRITIEDGKFRVGHHSKVSSDWVWIRFGGSINVGNYTNINYGGQLRSDESIIIGDYCMISYNVNVWDTNTHSFYSPKIRREITETYWPLYGKEIEKPKTLPVKIGNDVWIGENVSILKGTCIGNRVTIGLGTIIAGKEIPDDSTVISNQNVRILR